VFPARVGAWARRTADKTLSEEDRAARLGRAIKVTLGRSFLVDVLNERLDAGKRADELELELLDAFRPSVIAGRAAVEATEVWVAHVKRLLAETVTWRLGAQEVGRRYLAGRNPLFPDLAAYLRHVHDCCSELIRAYNRATRGRRWQREARGGPIDIKAAETDATNEVDRLIERLWEEARAELEILLGVREGLLSFQRILAEAGGNEAISPDGQ